MTRTIPQDVSAGPKQKVRDFIDGWYDYTALYDEGMVDQIDEKAYLSNKSDDFKEGWNGSKKVRDGR